MDHVALAARICLALVFSVAGLAKLRDLAGTRSAMVDFGLPSPLSSGMAYLLPITELVTAVALIPLAVARLAAAVGVALLTTFSLVIAAALFRRRSIDCHCFGGWSSRPIGWRTLIRNAVLMGLSLLVLIRGPGTSAVAWIGRLSRAEQGMLAVSSASLGAAVALAWFLWQLFLQQGRILLRLDALEAGGVGPSGNGQENRIPRATRAPEFTLQAVDGSSVGLRDIAKIGRPIILVFSDPNCGPCKAFLPEVASWQSRYEGRATIAVVSTGSLTANRALADQLGLVRVLIQQRREVSDQYHATETPSAVMIRPDGAIGSPVAAGVEAIRTLVAQIVSGTLSIVPILDGPKGGEQNVHRDKRGSTQGAARPAVLPIGSPAPRIQLPNLDGEPINLGDYRGDATIVLFWRPSCGFCQQMLGELRDWEASAPPGDPRLLLISTGSVEENRSMNLKSEVLLESSFQIGRQFGVSGTPSAVLVEADGTIASEPAVGAPAIWDLLAGRKGESLKRV